MEWNVKSVANAKGVRRGRPDRRRARPSAARRPDQRDPAAGAKIRLISDGDVAGAIAAAGDYSTVDMLMGVGGTPEGIITAVAMKCMGGDPGKLWPR